MTNLDGHLGQQPTRWVSTAPDGSKSQVIGFGCHWRSLELFCKENEEDTMCRQWSTENNMYYSLEESFGGEERSAFQVSGPTSLSVDHAASQLMAPCTHYGHCNIDQLSYPDALLPTYITIP